MRLDEVAICGDELTINDGVSGVVYPDALEANVSRPRGAVSARRSTPSGEPRQGTLRPEWDDVGPKRAARLAA